MKSYFSVIHDIETKRYLISYSTEEIKDNNFILTILDTYVPLVDDEFYKFINFGKSGGSTFRIISASFDAMLALVELAKTLERKKTEVRIGNGF